ncbi:MAG: InlB B-repeat-containing protein, partial [Anaerovoracaceae bacterium]
VPIKGGRIQAFDRVTLESLWVSKKAFDEQYEARCMVQYANGYIYTGVDKSSISKSEGSFFCIETKDEDEKKSDEVKDFTWRHDSVSAGLQKGFIWSGAAIANNSVIFGGDDGLLVSRDLVQDKIIDSLNLGGAIRSAVLIENGIAYIGTKNGKLWQVPINTDGTFKKTAAKSIRLKGGATTSSPVIKGNKLYGVSGSMGGKSTVEVIDIKTFKSKSQVSIGGFSQSSPLLVKGYSNSKNGNLVFLYLINNDEKGILTCIEDSDKLKVPKARKLFTPAKGYSLSSIISDENGTMYFTDGGANLYALGSKKFNYPANETYKLKFNATGGKVQTKGKIVTNTQLYGKLSKAKKAGYKFNGWYTKKSSGIKVTSKTKVVLRKNQTLYARWKKKVKS